MVAYPDDVHCGFYRKIDVPTVRLSGLKNTKFGVGALRGYPATFFDTFVGKMRFSVFKTIVNFHFLSPFIVVNQSIA